MTLLETIGAVAIAGIVGLGLGAIAGSHHEAGKWQAAVATEHQHELDAKADAAAAEVKLSAVSASADSTADQLEQAREALLAKMPPIAVCIDTADDVGSLRRLIEPR